MSAPSRHRRRYSRRVNFYDTVKLSQPLVHRQQRTLAFLQMVAWEMLQGWIPWLRAAERTPCRKVLCLLLCPLLVASACVIGDCGTPAPACGGTGCSADEQRVCIDVCVIPAVEGEVCAADPCTLCANVV